MAPEWQTALVTLFPFIYREHVIYQQQHLCFSASPDSMIESMGPWLWLSLLVTCIVMSQNSALSLRRYAMVDSTVTLKLPFYILKFCCTIL